MDATVVNPPLNAMQIHFLQSLRFVKTDEMFQELRQIISDYYFKKTEEETDKWWEENDMTNKKLDEMFLYSHHRISDK
ncbi:MAG: hypothetical protein FWF53_02120 [Candidatus Azobacteroides sp.]|nr:hypothetical protein [Candidatus Azobacteroides sp.]